MRVTALDIETAADPKAVERALSDPPEFSAPSNWKDDKKIEAEVKRKAAEWEEKIRAEAPLSELTGVVVAVGLQGDASGTPIVEAAAGDDETRLLVFAANELANVDRVVTFNGTDFDLRFLRNRMLMRGVEPPGVLRPESRYAMQRQVDLRDYLTGFDRYMNGRLPGWCEAFGVEPPIEHDGEDIAAWYGAADWKDLEEVVAEDVRATWDLYERVKPALPAIRRRR